MSYSRCPNCTKCLQRQKVQHELQAHVREVNRKERLAKEERKTKLQQPVPVQRTIAEWDEHFANICETRALTSEESRQFRQFRKLQQHKRALQQQSQPQLLPEDNDNNNVRTSVALDVLHFAAVLVSAVFAH